ncbi:MAG TPA: DNA repair protein RecO [Flavobacterium sp.]|nr:DNA repair protein RecO [Flavobacterium sp.]
MQVKTKAIVISALKYQEKSLIVKCFTETDGLKSYFVHNAFSGKNNKHKAAYFQPLNILEIEAVHKNRGTLEIFKEVRLASAYRTINSDVVKSTIIIFLSEVLHCSIREEEKNSDLFHFLEASFLWLDTHSDISNFHLVLLLEITKFLGFYPDSSDSSLPFFEMTEGVFTAFQSLSCLSEYETGLFRKLLGLRIGNSRQIFAGPERQLLLKIMLDYYSFHLDGFRRPRSLEVLREVFS